MNNQSPHRYLVGFLTLFALLINDNTMAENNLQKPVAAHGLIPNQISTIRSISRNVLSAKKSGNEDNSDAAELDNLRNSLEQLIEAEGLIMSETTSTDENGNRLRSTEKSLAFRAKARANARAMVAQFRQRGERSADHGHRTSQMETSSAGLPIGSQRTEMFENWANKLDEALNDDTEDKTRRLLELRSRLKPAANALGKVPIHSTPTLQAMPSDYVPSSDFDYSDTDKEREK